MKQEKLIKVVLAVITIIFAMLVIIGITALDGKWVSFALPCAYVSGSLLYLFSISLSLKDSSALPND